MDKFSFDAEAYELMASASSDPSQAGALLLYIANQLRMREQLCDNVADWLADAFEAAGHKSGKYAVKALSEALRLTFGNRRPAGDWVGIGAQVASLIDKGKSITEASEAVAGDHDVDQTTARRYWKKYVQARKEHNEIE
jgi:hypothetical protein